MKNLLLSYATDLNDAYSGYEFSIWSEAQLLEYFNEALCLIAAHRPDMFTELKVVKVDVCSGMLDLCDCVKVYDVLGQSDKNGRNIRPFSKRKSKAALWSGAKQNKNFADTITEYEFVDDANIIKIYPDNLDPTKDFYVVVRCSVEPKNYSLDDAAPDERCAFLAAAREWVLYCAKMVDGEFSTSMATQAKEHREMFFNILKLVADGDNSVKDKKTNRK